MGQSEAVKRRKDKTMAKRINNVREYQWGNEEYAMQRQWQLSMLDTGR